MLSMVKNPLKSNVEGHETKRKAAFDEGLRTLISVSVLQTDSNVVVKSCLKLINSNFLLKQTTHDASLDYCFLKSCFLCNKTLSLDKEVYMYRGDQGFCSKECRERQIYLNEMKELESYTKKMLSPFRPPCRDSGRRSETSSLLEEFAQRHNNKPFSRQNGRVIFS